MSHPADDYRCHYRRHPSECVARTRECTYMYVCPGKWQLPNARLIALKKARKEKTETEIKMKSNEI